MKKLNDSFNNTFDNVSLSKEKLNDLNIKILKGYKKRKREKRIILSVILLLNIMLISTGVVYANEIKEIFTNLFTKTYTEKGDNGEELQKLKIMFNTVKELNYDANLKEPRCETGINTFENVPLNKDCLSMYTYEELEKKLDIKLLKNDLFKRDKFILTRLERKDNKISSLMLEMNNTLVGDKDEDSNSSMINFSIHIRTKYNENNKSEINHGNYNQDTMPKYKVDNLNTIAYGIEYGKRRQIYFEHDNVLYSFSLRPSLESRDNPDKEVQKILDAFHY